MIPGWSMPKHNNPTFRVPQYLLYLMQYFYNPEYVSYNSIYSSFQRPNTSVVHYLLRVDCRRFVVPQLESQAPATLVPLHPDPIKASNPPAQWHC